MEAENKKVHSTDVHNFSEDGKGEFNWRMKFPIILPRRNPNLKLQIWDADFVSDEAISEATINLRSMFNEMYKNPELKRKEFNDQWLKLTHPSDPAKDNLVL